MTGKICPLMSKARTWEDGRVGVDEVMCFEAKCQMWEAQTGTCGLATQGRILIETNGRIEAAFERAAKIEERRQGHVVESSTSWGNRKMEGGRGRKE